MASSITIELYIEGFEDPFFLTVDIKGFDDPIYGLKKMGAFEKSLSGSVKVKGNEDRPIRFRSDPGR